MKSILLAFLLLAPFLRAEDELIAVDAAGGMLTIQHQGTLNASDASGREWGSWTLRCSKAGVDGKL